MWETAELQGAREQRALPIRHAGAGPGGRGDRGHLQPGKYILKK